MNKIIPSCVWSAIGIAISVGSVPLDLGAWHHPGAGLFPFLIGCGIFLLSTFNTVTHLFENSQEKERWPRRAALVRVAVIFAGLIFYAATLTLLGFILCTFFFLVTLSKLYSQRSWKYVVLVSFVVTLFSYTLLSWLKINLPRGVLGI